MENDTWDWFDRRERAETFAEEEDEQGEEELRRRSIRSTILTIDNHLVFRHHHYHIESELSLFSSRQITPQISPDNMLKNAASKVLLRELLSWTSWGISIGREGLVAT